MFAVVTYDIVDDHRRGRVAKALSRFGSRVQKSVFECLIEERQYLEMKEAVEKEIDMEEDSVRYYFLCVRCAGNIQIAGWGTVREDEAVIIV